MKVITAALLFLLTIPGLAAPRQVAFDFIEIPGATNIFPGGINDNGDISGYLYNQDGVVGFLKQGNQITQISVPGSIVTRPTGLDNLGRVTGTFADSDFGPFKGFLYQNGQYITFTRGISIYPMGVSDGKVVGFFSDEALSTHGFLYVNGQFTQLDYPGATNTLAFGINQAGKIVGRWGGPFPESRGFSYLNGQYEEIAFPRIGASTEPQAISNSNIIVGGVSGGCPFDQFMLVRDKFSLLGLPSGAYITGINTEGTIVGWFDGKGFIAQASKFILRGN